MYMYYEYTYKEREGRGREGNLSCSGLKVMSNRWELVVFHSTSSSGHVLRFHTTVSIRSGSFAMSEEREREREREIKGHGERGGGGGGGGEEDFQLTHGVGIYGSPQGTPLSTHRAPRSLQTESDILQHLSLQLRHGPGSRVHLHSSGERKVKH